MDCEWNETASAAAIKIPQRNHFAGASSLAASQLSQPSRISRFCRSKTCRLPVSMARVPMITGTLWQ